jgi:ATP/maltotriose-dependent transcriptional regulator MalT
VISSFQTVIKTKLHPPVNRSQLVKRKCLIQKLMKDKKAKLTLVAAPAGFGKTTLLGQWFEKLVNSELCCWYSLDHADDDPTRFLLHFIASLRTSLPNFGTSVLQILETTIISDITDTLALIINDLVDNTQSLNLFLDDYHFSNSEQINQFIELLINLSPENFHLIIAGRMRPTFPLSGLKVRGELNEITANHLRFDDDEARNFMNDIYMLDLSNKQLTELYEHSEGWVAGLQLASLSLRDIERRDEFIDSFSGNLRDIADYLAADVLNQQPEAIRNFLLRTAILQRLNADVCMALTGLKDSQRFLDKLEEQNLFILPLDQERKWYRYHHLFHEFLLGQLRRQFPGEIVSLYTKAAAWSDSAGFTGEAVDYSLLSGDMDKTIMLVESQVEEELKAGRMPRVNNWVDRIPEDAYKLHPKLLFAKCTALYHMNRADQAEAALALFKENNDPATKDDPEVTLIEAGIAIARDDVEHILPSLSQLQEIPVGFSAGIVHNIRGYALAELNDYDNAQQSLNNARRHHMLNGSAFGVAYADCFLGFIDLAKANTQQCYDRFASYEQDFGKSSESYVTPVPAIMRGIVLYEWNELDKALELLKPNLPLIEQVGHIKLLSLGYITLAKIYNARDDYIGASRYFDRIYTLATSRGTPYERLRALVEAEHIRCLIGKSKINEAIDNAASMNIDIDSTAPFLPECWERVSCLTLLIWSRLQIASGMSRRSLPVLKHLEELANKVNRYKKVIECKILQAIALNKLADQGSAKKHLIDALKLALPNRNIRTFIEEEQELLTLLKSLPGSGLNREMHTYINDICTAWLHAGLEEGEPGAISLVEPLSQREIEILQLIAAGQSNHVIADKLYISENTVKWHVKNIFGKLSVNKRAAAVVVAQQLRLLN